MSAVSLQTRVEHYLAERRRLGFSDRTQTYALRSFARYPERRKSICRQLFGRKQTEKAGSG